VKPRFKLILLSLVLSACVQSINPLYTDDTTVPVPPLVGRWIASSGDVLVVTTSDSLTYDVVMLDQDGEVSQWTAHATALAGARWLDISPAALPNQWSDDYRNAFLPLHQFWVLQRADSLLILAGLSYDSVKAALGRDPGSLAHTVREDGIVITADTPSLRRFFATLAAQPGVLAEGDTMRRIRR